jgi:hypothetical protein
LIFNIKRIAFIGIFLMLSGSVLLAQNRVFSTYSPVCDTCSHHLNLRFEGASFFQNNEYFDSFAYGLTGIGFYVQPTLEYYFMPNLRVNAGVFALKYSGLDHFDQVIPIFSIQYQAAKSLEIVFGNIFGTLNHNLEQPLFRYDRFYTNHVEYGMQFLLNTKNIKSDLWLHWVHFILPGDTAPERLVVGNNTEIHLLSHHDLSVEVPVQFLFSHRGGQLEPGPHYVATLFNGLTGLKFKLKLNPFSDLQFQPLVAFYHALNLPNPGDPGYQPFTTGFGLYPKVQYRYHHFNLMTAYWYGNKFIAPEGEYLFQSVSELYPNYTDAIRKLWVSRLWYSKTIGKYLNLEVRLSTYYDLHHHNLDYSYAFYMLINQDFFLAKYRNH